LFTSVFRRSQLLANIDDLDEGILNSKMDVNIQKRFEPVLSQSGAYNISYPVALAEKDDEEHIITSSTFTIGTDSTCYFRNRLDSYILEIVNADGNIVVDNLGCYDPSTGTIDITGFIPVALYLSRDYIKVSARPANRSTIRPLRNYIIEYDTDLSYSSVTTDYEEIQVTL